MRAILENLCGLAMAMAVATGQTVGPLKPGGSIELPAHAKPGGFDHAHVHPGTGRVFVAHTANDALDVIDGASDRYVRSIPNLKGVAGALVSNDGEFVFTSNRGDSSVSIFPFGDEGAISKVPVGPSPNGLAFDPKRNLLLVGQAGSPVTVAVVDVTKRAVAATLEVPGRTRWVVFDPSQEMFFVNVADPPVIIGIRSGTPNVIARKYTIPEAGPHGLALDAKTRRLFCACDGKKLVVLSADSGEIQATIDMSGGPDVLFLNAARRHLYAAIGNPGVIDVFDVDALKLIQTVPTERGANTLAFDPARNKVYSFLPQTHRAAIFVDQD